MKMRETEMDRDCYVEHKKIQKPVVMREIEV